MRITVVRPLRSILIAPVIVAGALSYSALTPGPAAAQAAPCDPSLAPTASDPWGYRVRGDRCEGIYAQPVAGTPLIVASFTERFDPFDADATSSLTLYWPANGSGEVRLRAIALRRRFYYRMDAVQPAAGGSWEWPADLLAALDLTRPELGVAAWTRKTAGAAERDVYLPLRIGARTEDESDGYALVVMPQVELSEVYVSVSLMDSDGRAVTWLRDEEPLGYGYYPADRPIEIPLARPGEPGLYRVQIGARMRAGGSIASELWFERAAG